MGEILLSDFSGGVNLEANGFDDYTERQWAHLSGVVLTDQNTIETQWACQRVCGRTDIRSMWAINTFRGKFLLLLDTAGDLRWTAVPDDGDLNAAIRNTTADLCAGDYAMGAGADHRMIAQFPSAAEGTGSIGVTALLSWRRGTSTGEYLVAVDGSGAPVVTRVDYGVPVLDEQDPPQPTPGIIPQANVGIMWGDYLVLGDTLYFDDPDDPGSSFIHHPNGVWFSEPGQPTTFHPQSFIRLGSAGSRVVGFQEVPAGLLVYMQSRDKRTDGLILLRGHPTSASGESGVTFAAEVLRGDLGACETIHLESWGSHGDMWGATGSYCFVDRRGGLWQCDGMDTLRLDEYGIPAQAPSGPNDHVCSFGDYLLASRGPLLYAMRKLGEEGAWTELVPPVPGGGDIRCMVELGESLYFVQDGQVFRFNRSADVAAERGYTDLTLRDATVVTRALAPEGPMRKTFWHRAGVRIQAPLVGSTVNLVDLWFIDGNWSNYDGAVDNIPTQVLPIRYPHVFWTRAHGPSVEGAIYVRWQGPAILDSITVRYHGGSDARGQYPARA